MQLCLPRYQPNATGAEVALRLSEDQLRTLFVTSLVVLGGRSFFGAIGNVSRLLRAHRLARKGVGGGGGGVAG